MSDDQFTDRYLPQVTVFERDFVVRTVAVDRILGREVLVTRLEGKIGRRAAVQDRFREAARSAVRLSHPNVVALYDIGVVGGMPYVIQEYSHSESLAEIIAHEGPFHPDDVAVLVAQVADALDYASLRGVPHLGLSPDVITVDYDGVVLVSDFGIGRVLAKVSPSETASIRYRSPELISSRNGDSRSDIYSLGVIAYEMLAGSLPFTSTTAEGMREQVLSGSISPPSSVNPDVPIAVSVIVMRALSRDPRARYESAGHFADALSTWQSESPNAQTAIISRPRQSFGPAEQLDLTDREPHVADYDASDRLHESRHRHAAFFAWITIAVALVALIWIASNLFDFGSFGSEDPGPGQASASPTTTVTVTATPVQIPTAISVIGMTVEEAQTNTTLSIRIVATETSGTVPAGQVIRQSPNPGRPVRTGDLAVVVSSGAGPQPINLTAISVTGLPFDEVAQQLTALGLNVSRVSEGSPDVPEGDVIRLDESSAMPGGTVQVVTSMGDRVQIPFELQSESVDAVVRRLDELGLVPGDPIAVSRARIESFNVDLDALAIVDGDVVGLQEENADFGQWVDRGATITPVFYDESLDP